MVLFLFQMCLVLKISFKKTLKMIPQKQNKHLPLRKFLKEQK